MPSSRTPERTCVGCRRPAAQGELIRVVRAPDGAVTVDLHGRSPGRGAYLHPDPACLDLARRRRGLERTLRRPVPDEVWASLADRLTSGPPPSS